MGAEWLPPPTPLSPISRAHSILIRDSSVDAFADRGSQHGDPREDDNGVNTLPASQAYAELVAWANTQKKGTNTRSRGGTTTGNGGATGIGNLCYATSAQVEDSGCSTQRYPDVLVASQGFESADHVQPIGSAVCLGHSTLDADGLQGFIPQNLEELVPATQPYRDFFSFVTRPEHDVDKAITVEDVQMTQSYFASDFLGRPVHDVPDSDEPVPKVFACGATRVSPRTPAWARPCSMPSPSGGEGAGVQDSPVLWRSGSVLVGATPKWQARPPRSLCTPPRSTSTRLAEAMLWETPPPRRRLRGKQPVPCSGEKVLARGAICAGRRRVAAAVFKATLTPLRWQ